MSQKPLHRKGAPPSHLIPPPDDATPAEPNPAHQELRQRWGNLAVSAETKGRLERILVEDAEIAFAATMVLVFELEKEERSLLRRLLAWAEEEIRLIVLEEGSVQITEFARSSLDTGIVVRTIDLSAALALPAGLLSLFLLILFSIALIKRLSAPRGSREKQLHPRVSVTGLTEEA